MGPPTGCTPPLPSPEVPDNVQKVAGRTPAEAVARVTTAVTAVDGQVGHLPLTPSQEAGLASFFKTGLTCD